MLNVRIMPKPSLSYNLKGPTRWFLKLFVGLWKVWKAYSKKMTAIHIEAFPKKPFQYNILSQTIPQMDYFCHCHLQNCFFLPNNSSNGLLRFPLSCDIKGLDQINSRANSPISLTFLELKPKGQAFEWQTEVYFIYRFSLDSRSICEYASTSPHGHVWGSTSHHDRIPDNSQSEYLKISSRAIEGIAGKAVQCHWGEIEP